MLFFALAKSALITSENVLRSFCNPLPPVWVRRRTWQMCNLEIQIRRTKKKKEGVGESEKKKWWGKKWEDERVCQLEFFCKSSVLKCTMHKGARHTENHFLKFFLFRLPSSRCTHSLRMEEKKSAKRRRGSYRRGICVVLAQKYSKTIFAVGTEKKENIS